MAATTTLHQVVAPVPCQRAASRLTAASHRIASSVSGGPARRVAMLAPSMIGLRIPVPRQSQPIRQTLPSDPPARSFPQPLRNTTRSGGRGSASPPPLRSAWLLGARSTSPPTNNPLGASCVHVLHSTGGTLARAGTVMTTRRRVGRPPLHSSCEVARALAS